MIIIFRFHGCVLATFGFSPLAFSLIPPMPGHYDDDDDDNHDDENDKDDHDYQVHDNDD